MTAPHAAPAAARAPRIDLSEFASPLFLALDPGPLWVGDESHGGDHDAVQCPDDPILWSVPEGEYWAEVAFGPGGVEEEELTPEEEVIRMGRGWRRPLAVLALLAAPALAQGCAAPAATVRAELKASHLAEARPAVEAGLMVECTWGHAPKGG